MKGVEELKWATQVKTWFRKSWNLQQKWSRKAVI
jgi:hypothetical protein